MAQVTVPMKESAFMYYTRGGGSEIEQPLSIEDIDHMKTKAKVAADQRHLRAVPQNHTQ